ncbi:hypothetical protein [Xanthomonas sp. MUS 060]|nr:hypothetical protein [Xanthomonas sp. MUS 060]
MNASTERHLLHQHCRRLDGPVTVDVVSIPASPLRCAAERLQ